MNERDQRTFNRLTAKREAIRKQAVEAAEALSEILDDPLTPDSSEDVEIRIETTQMFIDQCPALDSEIFEFLNDDGDITTEANGVTDFQKKVFEVIKTAEVKLRRFRSRADHSHDNHSSGQSFVSAGGGAKRVSAKLPKLEIKPFSGDTMEWQAFWDSFNSMIHENQEMADVDKMQYLRNLLTGKALDVIKGYRPTADNYPVVYKLLEERFGDPETAKFLHLEQLFAINSAEKDSSKLTEVYNECERHIRSLVALGMSEDTFGQVFVPLILSKLPKSTVLQLHRTKCDKDWDLTTLRQLMKKEIQARELSSRFFQQSHDGAAGPSNRSEGKSQDQKSHDKGTSKKGAGKKPWNTQSSMASQASTGESKVKCGFCGDPHYADKCTKFKTLSERKQAIGNRCYTCLGSNHRASECKRKKSCFFCKGSNHHSSLCPSQFADSSSGKGDSKQPSKIEQSSAAPDERRFPDGKPVRGHTVMMMAVVQFPNGDTARVYLDDGSSTSYVSSRLAAKQKWAVTDEMFVSVGRFGSRKREQRALKSTQFGLPLKNGESLPITAYVTDVITCPVQKHPLDEKQYPILSLLPLADPPSSRTEMVEIDILLGGDYCHALTTGEKISVGGGLYLYGSGLGYVAAGTTSTNSDDSSAVTTVTLFVQNQVINSKFDVDRFWSLEDIGVVDDPNRNEDDYALERFNESVKQVDGRYEVRLPWREENPDLNSNFSLAKGRLHSLFYRLKDQSELIGQYDQILADQLNAGIIERVDESPSDTQALIHYIPHHCVLKPQSATTKVRIVYDASAKTAKTALSLNDCLLRGPITLHDLCGLLIRFRTSEIAFVSDIEKAFHQILINPIDRDVLRFLWLRDLSRPPTQSNLMHLRFARLPFGMVSSPFLLDQTIKHHLSRSAGETPQEIVQNLYVDNVLGGKGRVSDAVVYYKDAKSILSEIRMNLREWYSNSTEFIQSVDPKDRGISDSPKVLGMLWNTNDDALYCSGAKIIGECRTKRLFLSAVASVFDPCGLFSAVVVRSKVLIQEMWKRNISWDSELPSDLADQVSAQLTELADINNIGTERKINTHVGKENAIHELHCFCDASAQAYAAVIYLRSSTPDEKVSTGILFSKARLAPTKKMTIPRLELMAAVIGTRMAVFVRREIGISIAKTIIWCDSKCVLHWLVTERSLKVFVRNRISELKQAESVAFRYVPTACNPADIPTKPITTNELKTNDLWWFGPSFLALSSDMWPENIQMPDSGNAKAEYARGNEIQTLANPSQTPVWTISSIIDCRKFSSWTKLLRVTAVVLCAAERWKSLSNGTPTDPDKDFMLADAECRWIRDAQLACCADGLSGDQRYKRDLRLFKDEHGIVRCRGRLEHSDLDGNAKFPKLLPKDHHVTFLVIRSVHENLGHAGVNQTLAILRYNYWVVHGRSQVQRVLRDCKLCRIWQGGTFKIPESPPLPEFRVSQANPFENTGIDYLGPLVVRSGDDEPQKVWICLFTCCSTRAIHLDVVGDLTADQFLLCLRRFCALYGKPRLIVSDNAKQFKAVDQAWQKAVKESREASSAIGIHWKYIPDRAPWMGGFYERLVGTVKGCLRKTLGRRRLSLFQLQTLVFEITAIVNSRPLVPLSDEPGDNALTPAHFLLRRAPDGLPDVSCMVGDAGGKRDAAAELLDKWKVGQSILNQYWTSWRNEYLAALRERRAIDLRGRNSSDIPPEVGTVVLIKDEMHSRCHWKMARIHELVKSDDGQIRAALVRTPEGRILKRPLKLLYPLEASATGGDTESRQAESTTDSSNPRDLGARRTPRETAQTARARIRDQLTDSDTETEY